ncbi:MAG: 50S ribosome-binding GTPase [Erysipelotrichaceae bacterium]|nr:50S ribosome-binding GTPase [Erysipelotrichaceae bacterium]
MKKCRGCGVELQYTDKNSLGYAPDESFDYCQRCFRLSHYGDISNFTKDISENQKVIESYKTINNALYVVIVDCFDGLIINEDHLLDYFADKEVLLVINKIDLLPKNITEEKINEMYAKALSRFNTRTNLNCFLTYRKDYTFNDMFYDFLDEKGYKKVVFVGRVNAGKSTLINKLTKDEVLTTSIYPGTTMALNELKFNGYTFIDTPGLLDEESYISYIDNKLIKDILPLKTMKASSFQLHEDQSYSVEGLFALDIVTNKKASVVFFVNNNLPVHRSKLSNAKKYLENNADSFKLKMLPFKSNWYEVQGYKTFYLKGLGMFKVSGNCKVNIRVNDKIKVYMNEVNI